MVFAFSCYFFLNSGAHFYSFCVSTFSLRTAVLWGPVRSTHRMTMPLTSSSTTAALNSWRSLPAREAHQSNHCKYWEFEKKKPTLTKFLKNVVQLCSDKILLFKYIHLYCLQTRHESISEEPQACVCLGRKVRLKFVITGNQNLKSLSKQRSVRFYFFLIFSGISYDKPLPPIQVASQRAERIAKEKKVLISSVPSLVFLFIQVLCHARRM